MDSRSHSVIVWEVWAGLAAEDSFFIYANALKKWFVPAMILLKLDRGKVTNFSSLQKSFKPVKKLQAR